MKCEKCSYHFDDGFCMLNCYYTDDTDECEKGTDEPIEFNYDVIYRLCNDYIEICKMYDELEDFKKYDILKNDFTYQNSLRNLQFFLNCCLNDLHREMSLWKTRR